MSNKSLHWKDVSKLIIQALALHWNLSLFDTKFWAEFCTTLHIPHQEPSRLGVIELNLKSNHYVARRGFEPSAIYYISIKTQHSNNNFWTNLSACLGVLLTHLLQSLLPVYVLLKFFQFFFFRSFKYWRWKIQRII